MSNSVNRVHDTRNGCPSHWDSQWKTHAEKRKDPRWQKMRLFIWNLARFMCEDCGASDRELHVHHCAYITGADPWDYDASLLMCLCAPCHAKRQQQEDAMRVSLGKITRFLKPDELAEEAWAIINELSLRVTKRMAESFS